MRIIYIWIEKYKSIQEQEFILRPDYNINFQRKDMCLSIDKNAESIDEILYGENINVTAIVGDNGVGKSTILDFIREIIFNLETLKKNASGFIVWEQDSKLHVHSFMNQELKVDQNVKLEKYFYLKEDFGLIYYSDSLDLKYYNNLFDDGEDVYTYPSEDDNYEIGPFRNREWTQYNISTSYLIKKSNGNILKYFHEEIKKQLQLYKEIKDAAENVIPFPIPSMMTIEIMYLDLKIFDNVLDDNLSSYEYMGIGHKGENNTDSYTIGLLKKLENIYRSKTISLRPLTVNQLVQWDIFLVYVYNLLDKRKENRESRDDYSDVDSVIKEILGSDIPDDEDRFLTSLSRCFKKEATESFNEYKDFYISLQNFRQHKSKQGCDIRFSIPGDILNALRETMFNEFGTNDIKNFDLYQRILSEDNSVGPHYMKKLGWDGIREIDDFLELFSKYSQISYNVDFFQCNWGMSSGENNLFCLFARLFDVMKINQCDKLRNIIFLLDELDGSFHPKWQQRIMKSITEFIQKQYPEVKFQIILTTHSPVLLSDVPKENTEFVKNKSKSEQEIKHEQTFAANIATLYYDSFFMEDGSIGEIAQNVIGNLIDTINETSEANIESDVERKRYFANRFLSKTSSEFCDINLHDSEKMIKKIKYLIDKIGEDFWRYKITEQFNNLNLIKVDNSIEKLLSELKELEKAEGKESIRELFRRIGESENDTY